MNPIAPEFSSTIRCDRLSIEFAGGVSAVDNVDLTARSGEILCLVGPSGCGKTTLLRAMAGLQESTSGSVLLDPIAVARRGEISFVFQQPSLLPWRTAIENVMLPLELIEGIDRGDVRSMASEMLHRVGLSDAINRFPRQLSGGMKMRVSIARALVTKPCVLLLDEPFAALDDMLRSRLGELLLDLWNDQRFTAVMVTHNIGESLLLSHWIAVMSSGRVTHVIENPLPRPRNEDLRGSAEFGRFYSQINRSLRGQS